MSSTSRVCPGCNAANEPTKIYCSQCGRKLPPQPQAIQSVVETKCPDCQAVMKPGDQFCGGCGKGAAVCPKCKHPRIDGKCWCEFIEDIKAPPAAPARPGIGKPFDFSTPKFDTDPLPPPPAPKPPVTKSAIPVTTPPKPPVMKSAIPVTTPRAAPSTPYVTQTSNAIGQPNLKGQGDQSYLKTVGVIGLLVAVTIVMITVADTLTDKNPPASPADSLHFAVRVAAIIFFGMIAAKSILSILLLTGSQRDLNAITAITFVEFFSFVFIIYVDFRIYRMKYETQYGILMTISICVVVLFWVMYLEMMKKKYNT